MNPEDRLEGAVQNHVDELFISIINALPDEAILSLPTGIDLQGLATRFPDIYETCWQEILMKSKTLPKLHESRAKFTESRDGTEDLA